MLIILNPKVVLCVGVASSLLADLGFIFGSLSVACITLSVGQGHRYCQ